MGLTPDQPILMSVQNEKILIRKLHSIEEILSTPPKVKINYRAWKQFKEELSKEFEK